MFNSLMELIAQYADTKSKIDQPYGEDDRLVLGQLAEAIANMYENMNRAGDKDAKHLASCWHDVSEEHFPSSFTDKRTMKTPETGSAAVFMECASTTMSGCAEHFT